MMGERQRFRTDALHTARAGRCAAVLADVLYALGVTHRDLAHALGVTLSTVDSWTRASNPKLPGAPNMAALCAWLEVRQPGAGGQVAAAAGRTWPAPPLAARRPGAEDTPPPGGPVPPATLLTPAVPPPPAALRPRAVVSATLPRALTSFVGRASELAETRALLAAPGCRLLTLTGPGGIGKTRLARELAAAVAAEYAQGVWWVPLDVLADPGLVVQAVAGILEVPEQPGTPLLTTLCAALQVRQLLLVLDNCEHLLAAAAGLADAVLRACPEVRILTTSREALTMAGETLYEVPALPVPDPQQPPALDQLPGYAAVQLFMERAQAVQPHWQLTAANARALAQLCIQLDGLPLALELAAARVRVLTVEQLVARLDDRFRLLSGGNRLAAPRQQTLRALLDWSYDLLPAAEQTLLRSLAVFAGGWTLEAAEAVGGGEGSVATGVRTGLMELVNKSLVVAEAAGPAVRYRLLETIRQYAGEKLIAAGEEMAAQERHRAWYLALAEHAAPHLRGAQQIRWLDRLEEEHANLRAALAQTITAGASTAGLRLAGSLVDFWIRRGYHREGSAWLAAVLALEDPQPPAAAPAARGKALLGAYRLAVQQGNYEKTAPWAEEALALYQGLDDRRGVAEALCALAIGAGVRGNIEQRITLLEQSLRLYRQEEDLEGTANILFQLGVGPWLQGDYAQAQTFYQESLDLYRQTGDRRGQAMALNQLGNCAGIQGDYRRAQTCYEHSMALWREVGDQWGIALALQVLGGLAYEEGDYGQARAYSDESLAISRVVNAKGLLASSLIVLAGAARCSGDYPTARTLLQDALRSAQEIPDEYGVAEVQYNLGYVALHEADLGGAAAHFQESLRRWPPPVTREVAAACLAGLAAVAVRRGQALEATQVLGALDVLRARTTAWLLSRADQFDYERTRTAAQAALDPEQYAAAWAAGQALTLDEALAVARAASTPD